MKKILLCLLCLFSIIALARSPSPVPVFWYSENKGDWISGRNCLKDMPYWISVDAAAPNGVVMQGCTGTTFTFVAPGGKAACICQSDDWILWTSQGQNKTNPSSWGLQGYGKPPN